MTMSPGCRVGDLSMWRKLSPSIAPSKTPGAVSPVTRTAARRAGLPAPAGGVVVDARAARCPAVPPKQIGGAAGFVQTHEVMTRAAARQADRVRTGGPLFVTVRPRARTARQTVDSRAWRGRPSGAAIRVRRNQRGQGVEVRLKHAAPSLSLDARRHLARVAPPL